MDFKIRAAKQEDCKEISRMIIVSDKKEVVLLFSALFDNEMTWIKACLPRVMS